MNSVIISLWSQSSLYVMQQDVNLVNYCPIWSKIDYKTGYAVGRGYLVVVKLKTILNLKNFHIHFCSPVQICG